MDAEELTDTWMEVRMDSRIPRSVSGIGQEVTFALGVGVLRQIEALQSLRGARAQVSPGFVKAHESLTDVPEPAPQDRIRTRAVELGQYAAGPEGRHEGKATQHLSLACLVAAPDEEYHDHDDDRSDPRESPHPGHRDAAHRFPSSVGAGPTTPSLAPAGSRCTVSRSRRAW